jgi:hypothetical protein
MKRRHFCTYFLLGTMGSLLPARSIAQTVPQSRHQWLILYWMPYDNDLSRFGEPIAEMITRGTRNCGSEVVVVMQSDYLQERQMRRRMFVNGMVEEIAINGEEIQEDSSDVRALNAYLDWAKATFSADHWAVIVVGHGGKINEISPDNHSNLQPQTWMGVDQFAQAVANFNQTLGGRVELLFFQNCHKATLEVIYEARNCAKYTLASQLELGAPNYYYPELFKNLKDITEGSQLASAIISSERGDMYHTFTLIDNCFVDQIPEKLAPVVAEITASPALDLSALSSIPTYNYFDEKHCDALILLKYLASTNPAINQIALGEFAEFLRSSVISHYQVGGWLYGSRRQRSARESCGLSLYFPESKDTIDRYQNLALSSQVDLVSLYSKMFTS